MRQFCNMLLLLGFMPLILSAKVYVEPTDSIRFYDERWTNIESGIHVSWTDKDVSLVRHRLPDIEECSDTTIYVWGGERIGMRGLLYTKDVKDELLTLKVAKCKSSLNAHVSWMRYVLTDSFDRCGEHPDNLVPWTVAEVIDNPLTKDGVQLVVDTCEVRPFWFSVDVDRRCKPGTYPVSVVVSGNNGVKKMLNINVVVLNKQLPEPADYRFHLDLWQQPYSVSRYYNVEPWSKAHLKLLRPYMRELARMGQKVVSTILFYEPWGRQSNDKFEPMVQTVRNIGGGWTFNYTVFDRWVNFMAECGIDEQIDCYSMIPWDMNFRYFDEKTSAYNTLHATTTDDSYKELWTAFLKDFAKHLREKGWFEKTCIAMDERGLKDMLNAYKIAQEAVPGMKMALAGNIHNELCDKLYDYSVAYGQLFTKDEVKTRRDAGFKSTVYTCCTDANPGMFSNSNPVDAAWIPLYCFAAGFDGWLHWSWLNWTDSPLTDSRFFLFAPGDTYFFYPGVRSSMRHERMLEGIQQYEKLCIVKSQSNANEKIDAILYDISNGAPKESSQLIKQVNLVEELLNR